MKCKNKSLVIALVTLIFSIMLIPACSAAIAVKEGDWAKYKIEAELPDVGLGAAVPFDEVDWMKIEVKSVSDTTVTVEATMRFKNGTELVDTVDGIESSLIIDTDIISDEGTVSFPTLGLVGAILPGESVYTNGTESREYAGVNREVQYVGVQMGDSTVSMTWKLYWDKAKGVLCELSMVTAAEGSTMSIAYKLIETNMWENAPASDGSSGEGLWILALVAIVVAVGVAGLAVLLWRRRRAPLS